MRSQKSFQKAKSDQTQASISRAPLPALPRWRWFLYLAIGLVVYCTVYTKIGGIVPEHFMRIASWREADALGNLAIAAVFGFLIMGLVKIFADQIFLGIVQRKSALRITQELTASVVQVAVGVAAEGMLNAAAGAATSGGDSSSADGVTSGGGGDFGGGGATGKF
jgi:uncharacterized membrane protein YgcG